jgi:hypothetical protein
MKEQIRLRWNPHESITPFIALNELKQSSNELQLTFTLLDRHKDHFFKESGIATFTFINPFAVRYSSEGDRLDLINAKHVDKESNDSILEFPIWPLFKVENSSLLQWQKEILKRILRINFAGSVPAGQPLVQGASSHSNQREASSIALRKS